MAYGQIIDKFNSFGKTLVCVWDLTAHQRLTVVMKDKDPAIDMFDLVEFDTPPDDGCGKYDEAEMSVFRKIKTLPTGIKPLAL